MRTKIPVPLDTPTPMSSLTSLITMNWLRVFSSAEASRLGHGVSQQQHTRAMRLEKCVALCGGYRAGMYMIAAFFARVLCVYTRRACIDFLRIFQEVRLVCKTRNQFTRTPATSPDTKPSRSCSCWGWPSALRVGVVEDDNTDAPIAHIVGLIRKA